MLEPDNVHYTMKDLREAFKEGFKTGRFDSRTKDLDGVSERTAEKAFDEWVEHNE